MKTDVSEFGSRYRRSWAAVGGALGWILLLGIGAAADSRYPEATWDGYSNGTVNISVYVFRDINRNGIYDIGDRPMSGILVDGRGNRKTMTKRSNMSGFANYAMSASDVTKDITFAGDYEFTVVPPPGWKITTGNAIQRARFEILPGSPADIVTPVPPDPVGLAPDLSIQGRVPAGPGWVEAIGPDGIETRVRADAEGRFRFEATPGVWSIMPAGNRSSPRSVVVGDCPVVLPLLGPQTSAPPEATRSRLTIGFDDLRSTSVFKVPGGYGGLNWDNFVMAHEKVYGVPGYRNNIVSGEFVAYNGSGHPAAIFSSKSFDFEGGYFGVSNNWAEGETLHIHAFRGAELAYSETIRLSAFGPVYFAADFSEITRLEFRTEHYWQVTFDELSLGLRGTH